jgi:Type II secretory pathway, prepilin signal peptidase PulO and related peptidases
MDVFPAWFLVSVPVLLSTVLGSFLNVVVARYPEGEPCTGRSHCPKCGSPIRARHNIPVFGWVMLRGRCTDCKDRISLPYPLVEVLTGVLFGAVVFTFSVQLFTVVLLVFACMSVALALIDLDTMRLPNGIVLTVGPGGYLRLCGRWVYLHQAGTALIRVCVGAGGPLLLCMPCL